jgi:hypothetical protein
VHNFSGLRNYQKIVALVAGTGLNIREGTLKDRSWESSITSNKPSCSRATSDRTLQALRSLNKAKRQKQKAIAAAYMPSLAKFHSDYAQDLLDEANSFMVTDRPCNFTTGREALPALENRSLAGVRETLERPDAIALESSSRRLDLLADADVVSLAVDCAATISANDSLEKMLAHQLAAAHKYALKHLALIDCTKDNLEKLRLTNAAARMMQSFQEGMKLLHKIRSGGRQTVVVQHVQVSEGGQAVIAGGVQNQCGGVSVRRDSGKN